MKAQRAAVSLWASLAVIGLCLSSGCAALFTGHQETRQLLGTRVGSERLSPLQEPPVPQLSVQVSELEARVQVTATKRCVAQQVWTQPRTEQTWTGYPAWAWAIAAAEIGFAALLQVPPPDSEPKADAWPKTVTAVLMAGAAVADVWLLAGQGRAPQTLQLAPLEDFGQWRLTTCGSAPAVGVELTFRGGRADWHAALDPSGCVTLAVDQLPARSFPYQRPLAEVMCSGCGTAELALDADAAAALVLARRDLEDLETWLVLHPGHHRGSGVADARQQLLLGQRAQREQARRAAELALEQGDLASAAQAVRRCQEVARSPAPACDALGRQVDDRFVALQLAQGRRALGLGAVAEAEAALYRCTLVERQRPACLDLERSIVAFRQQLADAKHELAEQQRRARDAGLWLAVRHQCRRGTVRACRVATQRCLVANQEHEQCRTLLAKMARKTRAK